MGSNDLAISNFNRLIQNVGLGLRSSLRDALAIYGTFLFNFYASLCP